MRHQNSWKATSKLKGFKPLKVLSFAERTVWSILSRYIRPCETRVRSLHLTNSFMYRTETIATAYEGAGWAFPSETTLRTPGVRVHNQGFEIIHCMHFPSTLVPSQLLESSLKPNWIPPADIMANEWSFVKRSDAPWQSEWNEAFNSFHCSIFCWDPAYI